MPTIVFAVKLVAWVTAEAKMKYAIEEDEGEGQEREREKCCTDRMSFL